MSDALAKSVADLATRFSGRLIRPGDEGYDVARKVHNGLIDKRPAVIAQCRGAADIADAIQLGRTAGLDIAVRGGGHNVAGRGTCDHGLLIDLSPMRTVHVDARGRIARVDAGALWRGVNRETQAHGLATTGGVVGSTGVAGLTLGGGLGWLMPRHGMALDNLQAVDLVLADGAIVRASKHEHSELFWAVRGGGGNFGVASAFEFHVHPIGPMVMGGLAAWPFAKAKDVLRLFRDRAGTLTDDIMLVSALLTAPDGNKLAAIAAGHFGSPAEGAAALAPLKAFGPPVMDMLGPIPYVQLNGLLDAAFPPGALNYWKSHFLEELTDHAIDALIDRFAQCPSPMGQIVIEHCHGAATRVPVSDTAFALRSPGFNTLVVGEWMEPAQTAPCVTWTKETYAAITPFGGPRRYVNYLDSDDASEQALSAVYGPNLPRLRQMKKKYDPDNVFHLNVNISPA